MGPYLLGMVVLRPCRSGLKNTLQLIRTVSLGTDMTLQNKFIQSLGKPLVIDGIEVIQIDYIPIKQEVVNIDFLGGNSSLTCGVALKPTSGYVLLPSGEEVKSLYVWHEKALSNRVSYKFFCSEGALKVWNIYRIKHKSSLVSEYAWTGNSCMSVSSHGIYHRRYECSDGIGQMDLSNHIFELSFSGI